MPTVFDSFADTPGQIKTEGQTIVIKFERTGPTTGKISWNIPPPAFGCASGLEGVYCGIVITVDNTGATYEKAPKDGVVYTSPDPTVDRDLHAGDKIGTAMVLGAFYQERHLAVKTTELIVTGLKDNIPYYVQGYAVDCQYRYHFEGVHAYSLDLITGTSTPDTPASHTIDLTPAPNGSDGTGLVPGFFYAFKITIDGTEYTIQIDGEDAQTYNDLIEAINDEIEKLSPAVSSSDAPNTGTYYWDAANKILFRWDGTKLVKIDAIIEDTDPSILTPGEYWYEPDTDTLRIWTPALTWNVISNPQRIDYHKDPANPGCEDYWLNLPDAFVWNGDVWCQLNLFNQTTDPAITPDPLCGTYWYDTKNKKLFTWNTKLCAWEPRFAIFWPDDPNTLAEGTFWFDETNKKVFQRILNEWELVNATVSNTAPSPTTVGQYWFKLDTQQFFRRDALNATWEELNILLWPEDPIDRDSCDLWWDSDDDILYVWDPLIDQWNQVDVFLQQETDPAADPQLTSNDLWYNPDTEKLFRFDDAWEEVKYAVRTIPPNQISTDDVWHDTANNKWYVRDVGGNWIEFDPIESNDDPTLLPVGTLWFDTTNDALFQWNGAAWIPIGFTTTRPIPTLGMLWFDSSTNTLKKWDGTQWVPADPLAVFSLTLEGDILAQGTSTGAQSSIGLADGDGNTQGGEGTGTLGNGNVGGSGQPSGGGGVFGGIGNVGGIPDNAPGAPPLFQSLNIDSFRFLCPVLGTDGVSAVPQQSAVGIGTDGSPDERREMMNIIRSQLGYPVIQVELTQGQLDIAIDNALQSFRKRSSSGYRRAFFFLNIEAGKSSYILSNRMLNWHKIVNIIGIYRMTSAFLSTAQGTGVYGQILLQHLYNMGTYDLLSYHLVAQYIEQLEHLFAARIVFQWDEKTHRLDIFQSFRGGLFGSGVRDCGIAERVLVEATFEKTEQEIMEDRFSSTWIQKMATAEAMETLAQIRGKFSTLPGAGGGISFNAADLFSQAQAMRESLLDQIDDYIEQDIENLGLWDIHQG